MTRVRSKNPFVLVAKLQTMKVPRADMTHIFGPMTHTQAIVLAQAWQNAGHWVTIRFPSSDSPPKTEGEEGEASGT